jgi:hypothetical protein
MRRTPTTLLTGRERGSSGRPADWQERYEVAKDADIQRAPNNNRADQLNPTSDVYWTSRGLTPPDTGSDVNNVDDDDDDDDD